MGESKSCPRCDEEFQCNMVNIEACQCHGVNLSASTRDYLEKTDYDCLCRSCLGELDGLVEQIGKRPFSPYAELTEGKDYYIENGLFVFTERYHIWKGYCCRKGCRHCAYGYIKQENS